MARKRNNNNKSNQQLVYSASRPSSGAIKTTLAALDFGLPQLRPSKPISVEVEFFSTAPRSFTLKMYGSAGEEIFTSPLILSGPIPRKRRFKMPANTDFGIFTNNETVVDFLHANNPSINFVVNIMMGHKYTAPNNFF